MGFNTPVLILNDVADLLESDPEAGKKIVTAIRLASGRGKQDVAMTNGRMYSCPVTVLPPQHADATRLIVVGQNSIRELAQLWYCGDKPEDILRRFADSLGYRVVKKPERKK